MPRLWRYMTPDRRLEHLRSAHERELRRQSELDRLESQRAEEYEANFQREMERKRRLDERETTQQGYQAELERSRRLDEQGVPVATPTPARPGVTTMGELYAQGRRPLGPEERVVSPFTYEPQGPNPLGVLEALDVPRQRIKEHVIEPLLPDFSVEIKPGLGVPGLGEALAQLGATQGATIPQTVARDRGVPVPSLPELKIKVTDEMVAEAASWILEPYNLLPGVGFGDDLMRAARAGRPALKTLLTKNPEARQFLDDAMRGGRRLWGEEAGFAKVPEGRPLGQRLLGKGTPVRGRNELGREYNGVLWQDMRQGDPIVHIEESDGGIRSIRTEGMEITGEVQPPFREPTGAVPEGAPAEAAGPPQVPPEGPPVAEAAMPPPRKPPVSESALPEPEPPHIPTVRETEARARPQPPEIRAQMMGEIERPRVPLESWDDFQATWGPRYQENWWTKIEDTVGGPLARTPEEKTVCTAFVQGDLYREIQRTRMRALTWDWVARHSRVLGLDSQGIATKIKVRPGAKPPRKLVQRLEDITEHPEDYIIGPEQQMALDEAQGIYSHVLQTELREGVDVLEVMGGYWRRLIKRTPEGKAVNASSSMAMPRVKPTYARNRIFGDIRELAAWDAAHGGKLKLGSAIEGMADRVTSATDAIANRRVVNQLRNLGVKPSERISAEAAQVARESRETFKTTRASFKADPTNATKKAAFMEAETEFVNAQRALRIEAKKVMERRPKVLGRLVTDEAAEQMGRYLDTAGPNAIEEAFRLARASNIVGDLSAMGIQGWYTFWADHPTWWAATFKGLEALVHNPYRFVAQNIDVIERGTRVGAITTPEEFLLRRGGSWAQRFAQLPIIRNTQNSFEWWTFTTQTLRYKAAERVAKNTDDLLELAGVLRNQTGVSLMPGLTPRQRTGLQFLFAPKFLAAMLGSLKDVGRPGAAGAYARRTVAMAFGGAMGTIVAGNIAQGKVPNLSDPDGAGFMGVPVGKGYVYPLGPFHPLVVALHRTGRAAQDLMQGTKPRPRDLQAWPRFIEGKLNKYQRAMMRGLEAVGVPMGEVRGPAFRGPELGTGRGGWMGELGEVSPIGPYQAATGIAEGAQITALEVIGGRTGVRTPYQTFQQAWQEEYPGRKYNFEVDDIVAETNPDLVPLLEARRERSREYGTPSSAMREVNQQFRTDQEKNMGLVESAQRFLAGDTEVGPQLMADYKEYKAVVANAMSRAMFGIERDPRTPEGKALKKWAEVDPYDEKYRDPVTREIDYDVWSKDGDAAFEEIRRIYPELADALETRLRTVSPQLQELEPQLEEAIRLRRDVFDTPMYEGISLGTQKDADKVHDEVDRFRDTLAGQRIDPGKVTLAQYQDAVRRLGMKSNFAYVAYGLRNAPKSQEYYKVLFDNQDALGFFFPELYDARSILPFLKPEIREAVIAGASR